jgi:hypothetical protein
MFAKDLSNKIFLPPRRQDTKFNYSKHLFLCLGAFVAILSGSSGLGFRRSTKLIGENQERIKSSFFTSYQE